MSDSAALLTNEQLLEVYALTKVATAIHVSEAAVIQTANDAMLRLWDKDRSVIGKPLEEALPELKGQPFIDMFKEVWRKGLTISGKDTPADLLVDGEIRTFYFDFEYQAIKDAQGKTLCILHTATDVTDRFLKQVAVEKVLEKEEALEREQVLNEQLAAANEELNAINEELQQMQENLSALNVQLENRVNERTLELAAGMEREQLMNEELKMANSELRYSEQRLDDILANLPSPIVVLRGPEQIIEVTNKALLSFWNKKAEEVIGRPMLEVFPELKHQPFPVQWNHVLQTGESIINREKPVYFDQPGGGQRLYYVDYYYQPIADLGGERYGVLATVIDVTPKVEARKQLEESQQTLQTLNDELSAINEEMVASNEELVATNEELAAIQKVLKRKMTKLEESESRFRSLVEQAPLAITVVNSRELIIDIVNDKMLEIWGKSPSIQGQPLAIAMPELEGQPFLQILDDVFTSGKTYYGNESKAFVVRNGELVEGYFNFICQPIRDEQEEITGVLQVVTEITDQVNIRLELQKTEEMMSLAIDAAKLGSWFIDPATKKLKYNQMLAKLFGYEAMESMTYEQAIGQVSEDYRDKINQEIENAMATGGDYDITYAQHRFNDGELIWLRSLGKVNQNDNGAVTFSGFVMDVTDLKKDEQRKNDFIGMVSHELKTPLTSLSGYIQMLHHKATKAGDTFAISALGTAGKQVRKMTSMINGFLNISRLESGKIVLHKDRFRLDELVNEVVEEASQLNSGHHITTTVNEQVDILADHDKISNVLSNLLSNAVKYAPNHKSVEVKCEVLGGQVRISVKDQGMGIRQKDLQHIFARYYRVEGNHTISGFGIGLYLSAEIIERHNGKIWVESEPDKGSVFYFTLPLN